MRGPSTSDGDDEQGRCWRPARDRTAVARIASLNGHRERIKVV